MSSSRSPQRTVKLASVRSQVVELIGDRRWLVFGLAGTSVVAGFVEAAFLGVVAQVAVNAVSRGSAHGAFHLHASTDALIVAAFALAITRLLLQVPLSVLPSRIAADVQAGLRHRLFAAFTAASWTAQSADREGQMQETMTSQVMQATAGALQATSLINSSITFLILMVSAFALNVIAAISVLVLALATFALMRPVRALGHRRAQELSAAQVRYARGIAEANRLAEDTQVFGVGAAQRAHIDGFIQTSRDLFYRTQLFVKLIPNLTQSLLFLLVVVVLAGMQLLGHSQAGALSAIVLLLLRAAQNGLQVQTSYQTLNQSLPFIERTQKTEREYMDSAAATGELALPSVQTLAFEKVSFAYRSERPVLSDISFEVTGTEAIGVIGPSGAGKSTLIQVLLRLRPPSGGHYLINDEDASEYTPQDWHSRFSYVPQEPRLIHASVADNIRFFRDVDDAAVRRAGELARIHDDVMGWPDGYETLVGPRADAVSGGQQQRICLARALVAHPEVLVLDEPTSALDPHSETLIQESLTALKSGMTLFIIAHRMSTLDMCDRVMVILDGRLVAFDTKGLLQQSNPYYRTASKIAMGAPGGALP